MSTKSTTAANTLTAQKTSNPVKTQSPQASTSAQANQATKTASPVKPSASAETTQKTPDKRLVIIDSFDKKSVDVNGDGKADTSHGGFISRLVEQKGAAAGKNVDAVRVQISKKADKSTDFVKTFNDLTARIKSGEKIDGINLSSSMDVPTYNAAGKVTGSATPNPQNLAAAVYQTDTAKQAALIKAGSSPQGYSASQKADIKAYFDKAFDTTMPAWQNLLSAASQKGIPVTVSSGNEQGQLNPFTLYEPSISVGASNSRGAAGFGQGSSYTSRLSSPDSYALGDLNHRKVAGGIDISGDGKADFKTSELSTGKPELAGLLGKQYSHVKASEADYKAVANYFADSNQVKAGAGPKVVGKVFDVKKLGDMMIAKDAQTKNGIWDKGMPLGQRFQQTAGSNGGYVAFVPDSNLGINARTVALENGKVVIDANGSGSKNVIHSSLGTSWAAPTALVQQVLKQK
jgi:hypothetical protein